MLPSFMYMCYSEGNVLKIADRTEPKQIDR